MNLKNIYRVVGLMSGTSLDGLDIAYCKIDFSKPQLEFEITHAQTVTYTPEWQSKLSNAQNLSALDFVTLNRELGVFFGEAVKSFIDKFGVTDVDLVASHGHTVFHQPQKNITVQIGCGANIMAKCGISVVCDFRTLDVALGGQGAPLVPIGDKYLFGEYDFCLNLGGIANISFEQNNQQIAYDICVANIALNKFAQQKGLEYDKDGMLAQIGIVNQVILAQLNQLKYHQLPAPKSLGKEWVDKEFFPLLQIQNLRTEDVLATICHYIAAQIGNIITQNTTNKTTKMLVTGGGAHNKFLINCIKSNLGDSCKLIIPNEKTVNYKEALIFALLGTLRWRQQTNTLSSVTGASENSIGGCIYIHN